MYLPDRVLVPEFMDEAVTLGEEPGSYRFGRSRVVKGSHSGKPYLVRWGLLEGIGERIYYQFAIARDIAVRPVQFIRSDSRVRNMAAIWWAHGEVETETIPKADSHAIADPEPDTVNPLDIPRSMALDMFLDNFSPFAGWMFEGHRVYRLFNHETLGLGSGPVPLLTKYRLLKGGGINPAMDLDIPFETLKECEREAFVCEAQALSSLSDDVIREMCGIPLAIGEEAFKVCFKAVGDGPGSRDLLKQMLKDGPGFLADYAHLYCLARQKELGLQLRLGRRA